MKKFLPFGFLILCLAMVITLEIGCQSNTTDSKKKNPTKVVQEKSETKNHHESLENATSFDKNDHSTQKLKGKNGISWEEQEENPTEKKANSKSNLKNQNSGNDEDNQFSLIKPEKKVPKEKSPAIPKDWIPFQVKKSKNQGKEGGNENLIYFEKTKEGTRKVHLIAEVCLRRGILEEFLCKSITKEHESILHVDLDGRLIHAALLATGAKPGSPAKFYNPKTMEAEYTPATGTPIRISLTYYKDGQLKTAKAQEWIKDQQTKKELEVDWVFAGSRLVKAPDDPEGTEFYTANNGDFFSVSNFPDSLLDLPIKSSKDDAQRNFEAFTERIPAEGTKVIVTLEPILKKESSKP